MKSQILRSFFVIALTAFLGSSVGFSQGASSSVELGRCSGENATPDLEEGEENPGPSKERIAQELICEEFDDNKKGCEAKKGCVWNPKPKYCDGKKILGQAREADEDFCRPLIGQEACLAQSQRCEWGYRDKSCNANFPDNDDEVEFCEDFDNNEELCEKNSDRCDWD